jgi:hypothetical protein
MADDEYRADGNLALRDRPGFVVDRHEATDQALSLGGNRAGDAPKEEEASRQTAEPQAAEAMLFILVKEVLGHQRGDVLREVLATLRASDMNYGEKKVELERLAGVELSEERFVVLVSLALAHLPSFPTDAQDRRTTDAQSSSVEEVRRTRISSQNELYAKLINSDMRRANDFLDLATRAHDLSLQLPPSSASDILQLTSSSASNILQKRQAPSDRPANKRAKGANANDDAIKNKRAKATVAIDVIKNMKKLSSSEVQWLLDYLEQSISSREIAASQGKRTGKRRVFLPRGSSRKIARRIGRLQRPVLRKEHFSEEQAKRNGEGVFVKNTPIRITGISLAKSSRAPGCAVAVESKHIEERFLHREIAGETAERPISIQRENVEEDVDIPNVSEYSADRTIKIENIEGDVDTTDENAQEHLADGTVKSESMEEDADITDENGEENIEGENIELLLNNFIETEFVEQQLVHQNFISKTGEESQD